MKGTSSVVAEAREWVGTPFKWGQSQKGVGCDCKGLVQGIARELGLPEADTFCATYSSYRPDKAVPYAMLKEGMGKVFEPASEPQPGDVLLLKVHGKAQHLAICCGETAIHAWAEGKERVKETRLELLLRVCPLDSVWRFRACS